MNPKSEPTPFPHFLTGAEGLGNNTMVSPADFADFSAASKSAKSAGKNPVLRQHFAMCYSESPEPRERSVWAQ